jgi:hypothetical protein
MTMIAWFRIIGECCAVSVRSIMFLSQAQKLVLGFGPFGIILLLCNMKHEQECDLTGDMKSDLRLMKLFVQNDDDGGGGLVGMLVTDEKAFLGKVTVCPSHILCHQQ